jgi:hypothetical protein
METHELHPSGSPPLRAGSIGTPPVDVMELDDLIDPKIVTA